MLLSVKLHTSQFFNFLDGEGLTCYGKSNCPCTCLDGFARYRLTLLKTGEKMLSEAEIRALEGQIGTAVREDIPVQRASDRGGHEGGVTAAQLMSESIRRLLHERLPDQAGQRPQY